MYYIVIKHDGLLRTIELSLTFSNTVEPRSNEPLYNEVLGITNDILQPGQSYSKMYGTEPRYNEILVITSTIQKP